MAARKAADGQRRGVFEVDQEGALAALELAWADGGYHGFCAYGGTWSAISSAGDVLVGDTAPGPGAGEQGVHDQGRRLGR
ncbi:MAG TPA: hypothetical protein VIY52_31370 [Streptosporangiaceae bacterium]